MTVLLQLGGDFSQPFYTGTGSSPDVPYTLQCAIQGHPFAIEPSMYERATVDFRRETADQSREPGEHSLTNRGPWRRIARDWGWGAGQDFWDWDDSDRRRFRESKGIDVFTDRHKIQLHHDTRNIRETTATNLTTLAVGLYLYVVDGNDLLHTIEPDEETPTFVDSVIEVSDTAAPIETITTDGVRVYAALGANGIHSTTLGATTSDTLTTYAATLVQYANGRLIAAKAGELVEVDSGGTTTEIKTHTITSFDWTAVAGAPNGIFAGGNAGDRSEWFYIGVNSATGGLTAPIPIVPLPDGETLNAMTFYGGVMIVGTSRGLRLAVVGEAALAYGAVIEVPGGVTALEPQGEDCWFAWKNYDSTSTGLGRVRLSRRLDEDPLVPAYASDLMATAQGTIGGVTTFESERYFAVNGVGFFAEYADLVASGTLNQGQVDFGVPEPKALVSFDLRHDPLDGEVEVLITEDDGTVTSVGASILADSLAPSTPFGVPNIKTEAVEVALTLTRDATTATAGPKVRSHRLRGLVAPRKRVDEWSIPVILKQEIAGVGGGDGQLFDFEPYTEFLFLKSLEASGTPVTLQLGTQSFGVQIERVVAPRDEARKWTDTFEFLEGVYLVQAVSVDE